MDGLSAAASIAAIIQFTSSVLRFCYAVQRQSADLDDIVEQLESLKTVLDRLNDLEIRSSSGSIPELSSLHSGPIQKCQRDVQKLSSRLQKSIGANGIRGLAKRITWPKERKAIDRVLASIEQSKMHFVEALQIDLAQQSIDIKRTLRVIGQGVQSGKSSGRYEAALQWLNAGLDPFKTQCKAWKKHQPGTGDWLICGQRYNDWKKAGQSKLLWLHGMPGCGKTILCSIVVRSLMIETQQHPRRALAYFYYDFNVEAEKRDNIAMLRSIVGQLASQIEGFSPHVHDLYTVCAAGSHLPDEQQLYLSLSNIVRHFDQTFIIIDALDESTERSEFPDILTDVSNLHVLVTSRFVDEVENALKHFRPVEVHASAHVDDIRIHVKSRLRDENKLNRLNNEIKACIEKTLVESSGGMFRWVDCQLDCLGNCRTSKAIVETLASLPPTLDETYSRILESIDEGDRDYAVTALRWMAFSSRPLLLHELAEVLAIRLGSTSKDDLLSPTDVLSICSSLITLDADGTLRFSHFSVKEYLLSSRILDTSVAMFGFCESKALRCIVERSLAYLTRFNKPCSLDAVHSAYKALIRSPYTLRELLANEALRHSSISASSDLKPTAKYYRADVTKTALAKMAMMYEASLLEYSATHWIAHIQNVAPTDLHDMTDSIIEFLSCDAAYSNWVSALELTASVEDRTIQLHGIPTSVPSSLTLALLLGLTEVACSLIMRRPISRLTVATDLGGLDVLRSYLNQAPKPEIMTATDRVIVRRLVLACSCSNHAVQRLPYINIGNLMEVLLLTDSVDILRFFAETSDYLDISEDLVSILPYAFEIASDDAIASLLYSQRVVETLSTIGTDDDFIRNRIRIRSATEKPLFMIGLEARQPAAFKFFLQYYDQQDEMLRDHLKVAIEQDDKDMVVMLLDAGTDPWDRRTSLNWNPLETAMKFESLPILNSLMSVKARTTSFADDYEKALLYGIKHCGQEFIKLLLTANIPTPLDETNARSQYVHTPDTAVLRSALEQRRLDGLFGVDDVQRLLVQHSMLPSPADGVDTSLASRRKREHSMSRINRAERLPLQGHDLPALHLYHPTLPDRPVESFHSRGVLLDQLCSPQEVNVVCAGDCTIDAGRDHRNVPTASSRSSYQTLWDDASYHTRDTSYTSLSYLTDSVGPVNDNKSSSQYDTDTEIFDNSANDYLLDINR